MSIPPKLTPLQLAILQALQKRSPSQNALGNLSSLLPPTRNALATGLLAPNNLPPLRGGLLGAVASGIGPKVRNVFYSFHYKDVFRVNHIRKSGQFRATDKERTPTPHDRSLWETARSTNPSHLKRIINQQLEGTSVTVVLGGEETWSREWVRYEIARSLSRGNGLMTVFIDGCQCPRNGFAPRGPNPLDVMGLGSDCRIYEWKNGAWALYDKVTDKVANWPIWLPKPDPGYLYPLSAGAPAYDWIAQGGAKNLIHWADRAAIAAGK